MFMICFVSATPIQTLLPDALDRLNRETCKDFCAQIDQVPVGSHQNNTSACGESRGCSSGCRVGCPASTRGRVSVYNEQKDLTFLKRPGFNVWLNIHSLLYFLYSSLIRQ